MRSPLAALGIGLISIGIVLVDVGRRRHRGLGMVH